jgi:gamma-glutamylputrescine oxidase
MPGYNARYWAERTAEQRRRAYPRFRGDHTAEVVVIGGGLTGCASAYALATAGFDVILVEADRIATGSTSAGLGAIVPEPAPSYREAEHAVGRRTARTAWKETHRSALEFATALKKLRVQTDLAPAPFLINSRLPDEAAALKKEHAARRDAGVPTPWLSGAAVAKEADTQSAGALRDKDAFVFDPVRAALGLAGAAEKAGARVFEQSEVRRTTFTRKSVTVILTKGKIRARGVVVATGEPGRVFGQLRRHVRRSDGFVVVTHPLTAQMRRETGSRRVVLTESGASAPWLRWLPDDRAIFAGALSAPVPERQLHKALVQRTGQLMYELSLRYPVISGLPAAWSWSVPVVTTPDGLPWVGVHRNYPFHFFALAFGWAGDSLAWFAARAAVRHFRQEIRQDAEARREDEAFGFVRHL